MKNKSHIGVTEEKDLSDTHLVDYLRSAISDGTAGLVDIPLLIRQIIERDAWRERFVPQTKEIARFNLFTDFVHSAPPEGLGSTIKSLINLCRSDIEALDLLARISVERKRGGDRRSKNFKVENFKVEKSAEGNRADYALNRLRRQTPELHKAVLSGKLSINQAMIIAGFRKKKIQIPCNVESFAQAAKKHFSAKEVEKLVELLVN